MDIIEATKRYEAWLGGQIPLLPADLRLKHSRMRGEAFAFLRATYYRWAQEWLAVCGPLARGVRVLSVGDLHVENFGTWRDAEGRLVWGVNDLDEAYPLPFTNDLIRTAASALLAGDQLALSPVDLYGQILRGYQDCLKAGGRPFVLVDRESALRAMVRRRLLKPKKFWDKLRAIRPLRRPPPADAEKAIRALLPERKLPLRFGHRIAGLGSLGRERYTALGAWTGGPIAREAKACALSACVWAGGAERRMFVERLALTAVRAPDPLWEVRGRWLVRRLSPECFRLELSELPEERNERALLYAMGWEIANIHLGSGSGAAIRRDLRKLPGDWLLRAAKLMRDHVLADWRAFRKG